MKRIRHLLEYAIVCLGHAVIPRLTRSMVVRLANLMGAIGYSLDTQGRDVGLANMDVAFGVDVAQDEKKRILKRSFQVFALVLLDTLWFSKDAQARVSRWVTFDASSENYFAGGPCVSVTAHMGNWEILGQAIAARGTPLMSVATPLKNERVDSLFVRQRKLTGQQISPRDGAIRRLIKELRQGRNVALLLDQNTPPIDGGIFLEFFGLPVPVSPAGAMLARRTGSRIYFMVCLPQPDGHYLAIPIGEILGSESAKVEDQVLTERILRMTEAAILKYPENWLWSYKRWKYIPPGRSAEGYPPYAHAIGPNRLPKASR